MFKKDVLQKILIILLSFYFAVAISFDANSKFNLLAFILAFVISFLIINIIFSKLAMLKLKKSDDKFQKKEFIWYGLILAIIFTLALFTFFPGIATIDSESQWNQVQTGEYTNWHPFVHTLLFFKLPSLFLNDYIAVAIFQLLFIGIVLLYFCYFLRKHFLSKNQTILILLLIVLNPSFINMSMHLWKDLTFSWTLFLGTLFMIELALSKGKWIDKKSNKIFLILMSLGILLFRHNGVISVTLLFLLLAFVYRDKLKFYLLVLLLLLVGRWCLYGPIYSSLDIGKTGGKTEMLGVISSQIAYAYHKNLITEESDIKLLTSLAPKKQWEKYYNPINFNDFKWSVPFNKWVDKHFDDVIKLWFKVGILYPKDFVVSHINITSPIWKIYDDVNVKDSSTNYFNNFKFMKEFNGYSSYSSNFKFSGKLKDGYNSYCNIISSSPLKNLFFNTGMGLFIITLSLFIVIYKVRRDYSKYLPFILVLSNTLVIMCLITGEEMRFVYSQVICALPLLIYALYLPKSKKIVKKKN